MKEQLALFGASDTQNHFASEIFGQLDFFPVKDVKRKCLKCLLYRTPEECEEAPCDEISRNDKLNGYFSIHNMPKL